MRKIKMLAIMLTMTAITFAGNIGYIDSSEIFQKYSKSRTIQANLEKEMARIEGEVKKRELALQKTQLELQGKGSKATDAEKKKFQADVDQFQKFVSDSQTKYIKEERARLQEISTELQTAINQVAKAEKKEYILEKGVVRFGGDNLTEKVLKQLESNKK